MISATEAQSLAELRLCDETERRSSLVNQFSMSLRLSSASP